MKATELRIGNLVLCQQTNEPCHVALINGYNPGVIGLTDIPHGYYFDDHITTIEGIPLTEEWLLKFGAAKTWDSFNSCDHWVINYNGDMTVITFSFEYGCDQMVNDLEFVHQLQNLYYSITGEELTIK